MLQKNGLFLSFLDTLMLIFITGTNFLFLCFMKYYQLITMYIDFLILIILLKTIVYPLQNFTKKGNTTLYCSNNLTLLSDNECNIQKLLFLAL